MRPRFLTEKYALDPATWVQGTHAVAPADGVLVDKLVEQTLREAGEPERP